ncbi:MAG: TonB family protein / TonB-dependent receptor, partial [Gemmatimonadetes bacterium]|nr:TonB family protein / TonB-dependent receptor [Gemmatimonadota bacterium]
MPAMRRGVMRCLTLVASLAFTHAAQAQTQAPPTAPPPVVAAPVIVPTKLLSDPAAPYPESATGEATVVLTLTIAADGTVQSAVAAETNEPFSSQAVATAAAWKFEPATRDGRAIASKIKIEILFRPPIQVPDPQAMAEAEARAKAEAEAAAKAAADAKRAGAGATTREEQVLIRGERVEPGRSATLSRTEVRQIPGTF